MKTGTITAGTLSGTALCLAGNLQGEDLVKTALLAAVGATVSFSVSLLLKWLSKKFR